MVRRMTRHHGGGRGYKQGRHMLEGQIAIVTGGVQGIGFAVAAFCMNAARMS